MKLKSVRFRSAAIAPLAIVVVGLFISGCGGSSSSSTKSTSPSVSVGSPDSAGYITVSAAAGSVAAAGVVSVTDTSAGSPPPACSIISATSQSNGSFSLAVCGNVGDTLALTFTNSKGKSHSLGNFVVSSSAPVGTGSANPCGSNQRQLEVANSSSESIWVSGGGSALRAVCVVSSTTSCLPIPSSIDVAAGTCKCGSSAGVLACPATAKPTGNGGLNCACTKDSQCGSGAGCNTNTGLCYDTLPNPTNWVGYTPNTPWNWEVPTGGKSVNFCLNASSVTYRSTNVPSAVWWGGGVFARTRCKADGTSCSTADCNTMTYKKKANPNADCLAGVGGAKPYSMAEFTLQRTATDYYDITVINGANVAAEMAPIGNSTAPVPSGDSAAYWCQAPGSTCPFDFGTYTNAVPSGSTTVDYSPLLMQTLKSCTVDTGNPPAGQAPTGCPTFTDPNGVAYSCSGQPNATNGVCYKTCSTSSDCPTGLRCLAAGNGQKYCQCETQSDCQTSGLGQFCGTTFVPGIGGSSPQLFIQQCGSFAGWWTADDFCGNADDIVDLAGSSALNCGASITDGDGSATNIASLFGCNGASSSSQTGNSANEASCYNGNAGPTNACCGCATDSANSLFTDWPNNPTSSCYNNNTTWASDVQPWLVNLKKACPTAYSYPYDDPTSTFQCQGTGSTNLLGYQITFNDLPTPSSE